MFTELLCIAVWEETRVHFEELGSGELAIGTITLKQTKDKASLNNIVYWIGVRTDIVVFAWERN